MRLSSLSIIIPCYNTQSTLSQVISGAYTVGSHATNTLEILALDDASSDETSKLLLTLQEKIPKLRILTHATNKGYGETIRTLYLQAKNEWIFSLPSDNQFDAEELIKLIPYTKNTDMILGLRATRSDNWKRILQSHMYNALLRMMFGLSLKDANSIRLMKKTVIDSITLNSRTAFVDAQLAILATSQGMKIREVPIVHKVRKDTGGTGGKFFKTIFPTIIDMVKMKLYYSPPPTH